MAALDLGMFTNGATDPEGTNFEVRAALNTITANFRKNRLYPGLAELVEIATTLEAILNNRNMYTSRLPRKLTGVDLEKKNAHIRVGTGLARDGGAAVSAYRTIASAD